jgi:ABC-2 type transport system permease protein
MNLMFKIAKTELRNLFYSPIAWFLTIAFFVQCAITYIKALNNVAVSQEMGGIELAYLTELTVRIFTKPTGLFPPIMQNLYLYIPLLTMGLISREINGGTISLLYSSPIKIREIVFGKYLAMLFYNLVLVLIISVFMIAGVLDIKSADWGMLLSAALGFYLLLAAYAAIGLFMSSLTSYQVVAAISTFITIGILSYIGTLWQGIDFVRDLTYFLSISGRTQHMLSGLISTKDLIYFILIVYLFLALSIHKLRFGRETKPWQVKTVRYAVIVISVLVIGYITALPKLIGYWNTTADKTNTLTANAQTIIKELGNDPLEVTIYSNFLDNYSFLGLPEQRNQIISLWEPYLRFKPDIKFNFVNYYDRPLGLDYDMFSYYKGKTMPQIAAQKAKGGGLDLAMFKTPEQIRKIVDLKPELNRFVMQLRYKGRTTFLRIFNDQMVWPSETEVSAAFKRLLQADMPRFGFISGDGERSPDKKGDREYKLQTSDKTFRFALVNQGFDMDTLHLDKQDIPSGMAGLVLADPQRALSPVVVQKITDYIAKGGNVIISGEPGRQQLINPLLKSLGVQLTDGMLEQKSEDNAPWLMLPNLTQHSIALSKMLDKPSIDTLPVSLNGTAALQYTETSGFKIHPLLKTNSGTAHNTSVRNPDLALMGDNGAQDSKIIDSKPGTFITSVALTRQINGKEQRIVVSGDADFMSNIELRRYAPRTSNFYFNTGIFSWLSYGKFPVDTSRPDARDNRVTVSTDRIKLLKIWYIWMLPGVLLAFGSVLLIRRKRK